MSRRKQNVFEDLVELPWWVGVAFAAVVYVVAVLIFPHFTKGNKFDISPIVAMGGKAFAALCLFAAFASVIRSLIRRFLLDSQKGIETIRKMDWREFEMLVGEAYRRQGYTIEETGGGGADGGIDLVLRKNGEKTLVQCKHWREQQVGVRIVRELYGVMAAEKAEHGIVVSSGRYTGEAREFAAGKSLTLVDGGLLWNMIADVKKDREAGSQSVVPEPTGSSGTPSCPSCGKAMVLRTAKRGANAGSQFWGCPAYPACKGIRQVGG